MMSHRSGKSSSGAPSSEEEGSTHQATVSPPVSLPDDAGGGLPSTPPIDAHAPPPAPLVRNTNQVEGQASSLRRSERLSKPPNRSSSPPNLDVQHDKRARRKHSNGKTSKPSTSKDTRQQPSTNVGNVADHQPLLPLSVGSSQVESQDPLRAKMCQKRVKTLQKRQPICRNVEIWLLLQVSEHISPLFLRSPLADTHLDWYDVTSEEKPFFPMHEN